MSNAKTIILKGDPRYEEDRAGAAITPGHLIEIYNNSGSQYVRKHSTEGGYANPAFALEDGLQGNEVDDAYAAEDLVGYGLCKSGDEVQAWLKAGENVSIGDKLISAGDGTLIANGSEASGTTVRQIIGEALEAVDLSASGASATRIDIRIL